LKACPGKEEKKCRAAGDGCHQENADHESAALRVPTSEKGGGEVEEKGKSAELNQARRRGGKKKEEV